MGDTATKFFRSAFIKCFDLIEEYTEDITEDTELMQRKKYAAELKDKLIELKYNKNYSEFFE